MPFIEANIIIDLPNDENFDQILEQIRIVFKEINGKDTNFNVTNQDNPITGSPINLSKG